MTELVVDAFEVIDIQHDDRQPPAITPRLLQRPGEAPVQRGAVGQPGERIGL